MIDCSAFSPAYTGTVRTLETMIEHEWNKFISLARRCGFNPEGYGKAYDELILDVADALTDK
jgi:hypothetical protein